MKIKQKILKRKYTINNSRLSRLFVFNTVLIISFILCLPMLSVADSYISNKSGQRFFPLVTDGKSAPLCVSSQDYPGIVFQKFVIDAGGLLPSYLGPPESVYIKPEQ